MAHKINDPKVKKIIIFSTVFHNNKLKITIRLIEECGVVMYCDLHAHSRKHNVFIYGCENRRGLDKRLHEQVFPLMLHKNCADKVNFIILENVFLLDNTQVFIFSFLLKVANFEYKEAKKEPEE